MHKDVRKIIDLLKNNYIRNRTNRVILTLLNNFENFC